MNQLERIQHMEQNLDAATKAVKNLSAALDTYTDVLPRLRHLICYYESPQWLEDYDADSAGRIPADLKRGVLSEDAVYNLLSEHQRLLALMAQLTKETEET